MSRRHRLPCGPCCENVCLIGQEDAFADLAQFTETVGSPSVDSGDLLMSSGDEVYFDPEPATAADGVKLTIGALTEDATAALDLVVGRFDDDNRVGGRLSRASGEIRIEPILVVGGLEVDLNDPLVVDDTGAELDESHEVAICFQPGVTQPSMDAQTAVSAGHVGSEDDWENLEDALVENSTGARYDFAADETVGLVFSDFDFRSFIPAGSTINGIACDVRCGEVTLSGLGDVAITSMRLLIDGFPAGDDPADGSVFVPNPFTATWAYIGHGSDTYLWGFDSIPAEKLMDPNGFGFAVEFTCSPSSVSIRVDNARVSVWYTTPDKTRGQLTISYKNSSDDSVQCAKSYSVYVQEPGTGTGLKAGGGDWRIGSYKLEYLQSASRPSCPNCACPTLPYPHDCTCCDSPAPPRSLVVSDLGGLTNDGCGNCAAVDGAYVLDPMWSWLGVCYWGYQEPIECGTLDCDDWDDEGTITSFSMLVWLEPVEGGCRWKGLAMLGGGSINQDPSNPDQAVSNCGAVAEYQSDVIEDDECATLPATLNRTGQVTGGSLCGGSFPETLTLDTA